MGLDMYFHRKTYVKNWDHHSDEQKHKVTVKLGGKKHPYIKPELISEISEEVGYWRKANAIHKWFVENVQNGEDDCREYYVDIEKLKDLYDRCNQIMEDNTKANELLPTQSGFFFGSTEYDEWYFNDIKQTIEILKPIIELNDELSEKIDKKEVIFDYPEYYYQSSW